MLLVSRRCIFPMFCAASLAALRDAGEVLRQRTNDSLDRHRCTTAVTKGEGVAKSRIVRTMYTICTKACDPCSDRERRTMCVPSNSVATLENVSFKLPPQGCVSVLLLLMKRQLNARLVCTIQIPCKVSKCVYR